MLRPPTGLDGEEKPNTVTEDARAFDETRVTILTNDESNDMRQERAQALFSRLGRRRRYGNSAFVSEGGPRSRRRGRALRPSTLSHLSSPTVEPKLEQPKPSAAVPGAADHLCTVIGQSVLQP